MLPLSLSRLDFLVILGWQWSASRGVVRFHPGLSSPYRIWASPPHLPCLPPPSVCVCVCDLKTWDLGSSVCVCYHMCVCVCARSWDLPFFKVLIGHSVFNDAAGDETETSCERQRLLAQRRACCPGLPRGLVRVPATRSPPSAAPAPRAIELAVGRGLKSGAHSTSTPATPRDAGEGVLSSEPRR